MPRIVGVTEAAGATVETDPWLPLTVKWRVPRRESWLRLFLKDPTVGFVELNVDPGTRTLVNFTVINLPRPAVPHRPLGQIPLRAGTAMLSWERWPPLQGQDLQYSDLTWPLSVAVSAGRLTVWLGPDQPSVGLQTDDVVAAVAADGDLLAVSVPWPQQAAELWPEADS